MSSTIKEKIALEKAKIQYLKREKVRKVIWLLALDILIWTLFFQIALTPRVVIIENANAEVVKTVSPDSKIGVNQLDITGEKEETQVSPADIQEMIRSAFPEDSEDMIAIASAESRFKTDAVNLNINGTKDCGIFQVNEIHGYDCEWLKDPKNNIKAALEVYKKQGKKAWATFNFAQRHNLPI